MRALLVVPRLPGTGYSGDRLRAELHLSALRASGFEVTVAGGAPPAGAAEVREAARTIPVPQPLAARGVSLVTAVLTGSPLQSAFFAGPWREALAAAGGPFDLAVVLLAQRLGPALSGALPKAPVVVDYVDALAAAARQAASTDPALWRRLYWRLEAPRLERAERAAAGARVLLATTPFDAARLPAGTVAVANGVEIGPAPGGDRGPVVAFTGRLRYRPNELAVKRLVKEIWPEVRAEVPGARLLLGGADAPPEVTRLDGQAGIEVTSPVPDMSVYLRRARAVAIPVALGTGTPNKLFEAFEAGCAVVASEEAAGRAAAGGTLPPAVTASSSADFASSLVRYLRDPARAASDGSRGRAWVEANADRRHALAALSAAYRRARGESA
ncbi:MAG TPA: glycosyltransferase [Thermoanaerobaculia bacterium]|nr:glycosyltransferase [Thermoanaerobaculia bacterium]